MLDRRDLEHLQLSALVEVRRVIRQEPVDEAVRLLGVPVHRAGRTADVLDDIDVAVLVVLDAFEAADPQYALKVPTVDGKSASPASAPRLSASAVNSSGAPTDPTSSRRSAAPASSHLLGLGQHASLDARRPRRG